MTNITEQRKVFFLIWPFFAHAAQEELYRLIFTSKEREAHQLPARYPGPRKPCSKASFALPVSLAEEKQALNASDIPSSFVRPIRSDAPHNVEMMAISEVASSAHSENDMDGDDFPQWTDRRRLSCAPHRPPAHLIAQPRISLYRHRSTFNR